MSACYIHKQLEELKKNPDGGFMGTTHALSALAFFLLMISFFTEETLALLGTADPWVLVLALIVTAGSALIPDLDNTASTSKSSLGYLGDALSVVFRVTSTMIQSLVRMRRDDPTPNPHRGFYHTIPGALLIGGLVFAATRLTGGDFTAPFLGEMNFGKLSALIITWLCIHMAIAGLAKDFVRKVKRKHGAVGELVNFIFSFGCAAMVWSQIPPDLDFWWLGVSVALGCFFHSLGDCFTTSGCPILFPLPIKGKMWWDIRFTKIKAGGVVENAIFVPVFGIICVVSILNMAGFFTMLNNIF